MRKVLCFLIFAFGILLSGAVLAGRTPGFSMTAFGAAVPNGTKSGLFSPYAFELDCALISEAFGPLEKAKFVETLGALVGYESVFGPLVQRYSDGKTNDFDLVSARAFITPSLRLISTKFRIFAQNEYGAHACPVRPVADGAESFLRTAMDGTMEDFRLPKRAVDSGRVSFFDLETFRCRWAEPFPRSNTGRIPFTAADGSKTEVEAMSDRRVAELWQADRFTAIRLPMTDGAYFIAVLPAPDSNINAVRGEFAGYRLDNSLFMFKSITEKAVTKGPVTVVIPRLSLDSTVDLAPVFNMAELPLGGFKEIFLGEEGALECVVQHVRFTLDESGPGGRFIERRRGMITAGAGGETRKFVCDRPFLFFVYHEPTRTVPIAGIFAGDRQ